MEIKDIIKKNRYVKFAFYRNGYLYYTINIDEQIYQFPVPIEDLGDSTCNKIEKSIMMMRYVRRSLIDKTFVKV